MRTKEKLRIDCTSESLDELTLDDLVYAVDSGYWGNDTILVVALNIVSLLSDKGRRKEFCSAYKECTGESLYTPTSPCNPAYYSTITYENLVTLTAVLTNRPRKEVINELSRFLYNHRFFQRHTFYSLSIQHRHVVYPSKTLKSDEWGRVYLWDYSWKRKLTPYSERVLKERLMEWEARRDELGSKTETKETSQL